MSCKDILFILSMAFAFSSRVNARTFVPASISYGIAIFWIAVALFELIYKKKDDSQKRISEAIGLLFKYNNIIRLVIYIYTIIIIMSGISERRFLSSNLQTFINGVSGIAAVWIFKERAFRNSVAALICACIFSFLFGITTANNFSKQTLMNILELHDIAFAVGLVILYYFCSKQKWNRKDYRYAFICILIFALAFKRIGIVALVAAIIFWKFTMMFINVNKRVVVYGAGLVVFAVCFSYVWVIVSGNLWNLVSHGIFDFGGRDYYYRIFIGYDFSPRFLGLGRNAVQTIVTKDYDFFHIGNIHNDILKMYIECGFILFSFWMINYLFLLPRKIYIKYGTEYSVYVFTVILYMFILYLTDNVDTYLDTQFFFIIVIAQKLCFTRPQLHMLFSGKFRFEFLKLFEERKP